MWRPLDAYLSQLSEYIATTETGLAINPKGTETAESMYRVFGFIENLSLKVPSFDLGQGFRLRQLLQVERKLLLDVRTKLPNQWSYDSINSDDISAVAETAVLAKFNVYMQPSLYFSKTLSDASWTIRLIARALLLYTDRLVKLRLSDRPEKGELPVIVNPASFQSPGWAQRLHTPSYREPAILEGGDLGDFKKFFWDFQALMEPGPFRMATRYFTRASNMAGLEWEEIDYRNLDSRFMDYITCLEALVGERDEITQKLALRTAVLVGGATDDRQDTFDFIRTAYSVRSRGIHGSGVSDVLIRNARASPMLGIVQDVNVLHWYCRLALRRLVDLHSAIKQDKAVASKLPSRKRRDSWIRELLDYCLVRSELAVTLERFFEHSCGIVEVWTEYAKTRHPYGVSGRSVNHEHWFFT